jgi:hypothetical protein
MLFSQFFQYLSSVCIIKDTSSGLIDLQKKLLGRKSIVFNKDENLTLKLSKLPLLFSLFTKQRFILSIISNDKSITLNPGNGWHLSSRNNAEWMFTKEDAKNISIFLGIPLLNENESVDQTTKYDHRQSLSGKGSIATASNLTGINITEARNLTICGVIGFFVGLFVFILALGIGTGLGLSDSALAMTSISVFFITFIFITQLGRKKSKNNSQHYEKNISSKT